MEDIFAFTYAAEVIIVSEFITEKLAVFASLLSGEKRVLLIAPIYETPNGLQHIPEEYLGIRRYSNAVFQSCGIHRASNENLETVLLHNFDYFACSEPPLFDTLQHYFTSGGFGYTTTSIDWKQLGAHNFLKESELLAEFSLSLSIGRYNEPEMLVSTGGCSSLAAAALERHFLLNGLSTRAKNEIVEPYRTHVVGWLEDVEFSNEDIFGVCDVGVSELERLHLQINNWIDPFNNKLFGARGMLLQFDALFCTEFVATMLRNREELSWCCENIDIIKENLLGIMEFFAEVEQLLQD